MLCHHSLCILKISSLQYQRSCILLSSWIPMQAIDSSWKPNSKEQEFPGIMTDLVLTDCYLPESPVTQEYFDENKAGTSAAGLMISVSNDGEHRSEKNLTFISYDSACMSCEVSTGCFYKVNTLIYIYPYSILCTASSSVWYGTEATKHM